MDYYENLIANARHLIHHEKYQEAYSILETELNMPYIPYQHEAIIAALFKECQQALDIDKRAVKYDGDDIETLLFSDDIDEACVACELLKGSNVRNYLEIIENYLKKSPHYLVRTLLIETLMDQDVTDEIQLDYDGLQVTFIPTYVERIQESEVVREMVQQLKDYFENDNPTFYQMCVDCLVKELYLKLPFNVENDEVNYLLKAIIEYVFKANGDEASANQFIREKNLAMYGGYDLLLYKYDV